jgi:hypothetical protein
MFQTSAHIQLLKFLEVIIQTKCTKFNYLILLMLFKTTIYI